jgi:DNA-binding PadR family transcriptional regulator
VSDPEQTIPEAPEFSAPASERRRPSRAGRGGSLLELALLGLLGDGELHGYELKKQLDGVLPAGSSVSFGSLYPTLGRLERTGDVRALHDDDSPVSRPGAGTQEPTADTLPPMTGALSGELATFRTKLRERSARPGRSRRGRKVYAITSPGRARLLELLTTLDPADDRTFALQIAFSRHLDNTQRLTVLTRRRAQLSSRLGLARSRDVPMADRWRESLRTHALTTITAEIIWVDELIAAEEATRFPVNQTSPPAVTSVAVPVPSVAHVTNPGGST